MMTLTRLTTVTTWLLTLVSTQCPDQCECEDGHSSRVTVTCLTAQMKTFPNTLNPQLESIMIRKTDISHVDSAFLWFFPKLIQLDLSENSLNRVAEKTWVHNPRLVRISLANNKIEVLPDLQGLQSLTSLNLSHNALQTLPEDVVTTRLEQLDLSRNQVDRLPPLPSSLELLNVSHNKISSVSDVLSDLPHLLHLDLSDNPLLRLLPPDLSLAPGLLSLSLASTGLQSVPSAALQELADLTHLDLSHNNLTVLPSLALSRLSHLESLTVSHCPLLTSVESAVFSPNLARLDLSHNPRLSSLHPDSLVGLPRLERVLLQGDNLSSAILPASLQSVEAEDNPWLCDCDILRLQQILSDLSPVLCAFPAQHQGLPVIQVSLHHCLQDTQSGRQRDQVEGEGEGRYNLYFYCIVCAGSISIMVLLTIFCRKHLVRAFNRSRKAEDKLKDIGCEKSFIQYDEYFLSLARYQAELENNASIPVTEL